MADNSGKLQKKRSNKVTASFASSSSPVAVSMGKKAIRKTSQVAPLLPTVEASSWGLDEAVTDLTAVHSPPPPPPKQHYLNSQRAEDPLSALQIPGAIVLPAGTGGSVTGSPIIIIPQSTNSNGIITAPATTLLALNSSPPSTNNNGKARRASWARNGNVISPAAAMLGTESPVPITNHKRNVSNASAVEYRPLYRPKPPRRLEELRRTTAWLIFLVSLLASVDIFFSLWWLQDAVRQYLPSFVTQQFGPDTATGSSLRAVNLLNSSCALQSTQVSYGDDVEVTVHQFTSSSLSDEISYCPHNGCILTDQCTITDSWLPTDHGLPMEAFNETMESLNKSQFYGNPPKTCSLLHRHEFMAVHCEYSTLFDSQTRYQACMLVNASSWGLWPHASSQELQQVIAWNAKFAGQWPYLTYCKVRYQNSFTFQSLHRRNERIWWLLPRIAYPPAAVGLVMAATASTCLFHVFKIFAILLGWCTKSTRKPAVVVWTSNSPLWLLLTLSDYYRTLVTMSFQKISLKFQLALDLLFSILPHSISVLFLYLTVDEIPQTALYKITSSATVLLFDLVLVFISAAILNIDNRKLWNQEQIDNEYFVYRCLKNESK